MGICGPLGLALFFFGIAGSGPFHANLGVLSLILVTIEALAVYTFLRNHSLFVRVLPIIAIGCINSGIAWIIESIFRSSDPSREISQFWNLVVLLMGLLVGGTLSGFLGQALQRRFSWLKRK